MKRLDIKEQIDALLAQRAQIDGALMVWQALLREDAEVNVPEAHPAQPTPAQDVSTDVANVTSPTPAAQQA
jgi:ketosteroid isomerase-like protein